MIQNCVFDVIPDDCSDVCRECAHVRLRPSYPVMTTILDRSHGFRSQMNVNKVTYPKVTWPEITWPPIQHGGQNQKSQSQPHPYMSTSSAYPWLVWCRANISILLWPSDRIAFKHFREGSLNYALSVRVFDEFALYSIFANPGPLFSQLPPFILSTSIPSFITWAPFS